MKVEDIGVSINRKIDELIREQVKRKPFPTHYTLRRTWNICSTKIDKCGTTTPKHEYDVHSIHHTNDPSCTYYLVDRLMRHGVRQDVFILAKPLTPGETRGLKNINNHPEFSELSKTRFVKEVPQIEASKLFRIFEREGIAGSDIATFLATDGGIPKDNRIVRVGLSQFIPLRESIFGLGDTQRLNCHSVEITNSGTAKTTTAEVMGYEVHTGDITEAYLLGGRNNLGIFCPGALSSYGVRAFDEFNFSDEPSVVSNAFNMMENGIARRSIKEAFTCRGTKTVKIMGNATLNEKADVQNPFPAAFDAFIHKVTDKGADPTAFGRRIGIVMYQYDFLQIKSIQRENVFGEFVPTLRSTLEECIHRNYASITKIFRHFGSWIDIEDKDYLGQLEDSLNDLLYEKTRRFFEGLLLNSYKIKSAVIRALLLDNIDLVIMRRKQSDIIRKIDEEKDDLLKFFQDINLSSVAFCSVGKKLQRGSREYVKAVKSTLPDSAGYRKVAKRSGVSHQTVKNWLQEDGRHEK